MQYVHWSKEEIVAEYAESSAAAAEHERAKWGSPEGMINRFRLGLSLINWAPVRRWLDIGCGGGAFFAEAEQSGLHFDEMIGIDITGPMIAGAECRHFRNPVRFIEADLESFPAGGRGFDLVTLVGVLQQCGSVPEQFLPACVAHLRPGGQLFLTTKNLAWDAFTKLGWVPEPSHSWFHFEEIGDILAKRGIDIEQHGGFLPGEGRVVPLEQSHTMFLLGRLKA